MTNASTPHSPTLTRTLSRRTILKTGLIGMMTSAFALPQLPVFANTLPTSIGPKLMIDALKAIGTNVTIAAAKKLESTFASNTPFSLHLRNAELSPADAETLAIALEKFIPKDRQVLASFSVSYNASMGDDGAIALVKALPDTVNEIGFVGCAIGDKSGQELLKWAKNAPNLRVMCIENNKFSSALKAQIQELSTQKANLLVIV
jgi:hypothetical protein